MQKLHLGEDTYTEAEPSWSCVTEGTIRLGPAQIVDPGNILEAAGGPTMQDIAAATWKVQPGNWARAMNPWKPTRGGVSEIQAIFQQEGGSKWCVILRGQTKTYQVVKAYEVPAL